MLEPTGPDMEVLVQATDLAERWNRRWVPLCRQVPLWLECRVTTSNQVGTVTVSDGSLPFLALADRQHPMSGSTLRGVPADTALHEAARSGEAGRVTQLLAAGECVNTLGSRHQTALHEAAQCGCVEVARILLLAAADPNAQTVWSAAAKECYEKGMQLVGCGGLTALHVAAERGEEACVQLILNHPSIDLLLCDHRGTVLITAARKGRDGVIRLLAQEPQWRSLCQETGVLERNALHHAAELGRIATCCVLLELAAEMLSQFDSAALTPLHLAAKWGHAPVVSLMLEHRGDPTTCGVGSARSAIDLCAENALEGGQLKRRHAATLRLMVDTCRNEQHCFRRCTRTILRQLEKVEHHEFCNKHSAR